MRQRVFDSPPCFLARPFLFSRFLILPLRWPGHLREFPQKAIAVFQEPLTDGEKRGTTFLSLLIELMQLNAQSIVVRRFIAAPINRDSNQLDTVPNPSLGTDAR